ncbi:TonB-dependent receptor [Massilibacteroides vaginae]|uniref:TonB-dependent receptor n=1 Tax=Massilibacteroides vaginae TaxID=1673718 RepID=UPI001FEAA45B|nr:TonB-dependent receptor [Massilibacteroides vaginae]
MRLTVVFLFIGIGINISSVVYCQSTFLSLSVKDKSIKDVFREIENNSDYIFFYYDEAVDVDRRVTIRLTEKTINEILDAVFESTENTYAIEDRQIFIICKDSSDLKSTKIYRRRIVSGIVLDVDIPLIGVNILVKGTGRGTTTDLNGHFTVPITQANATLVFSYMGYKTKEMKIADQTHISCQLETDALGLKEVVVVGYGMIKKENMTGSITSVKGDKLRESSSFSAIDALQGRAAGVTVMMQSAKPGEEANIRIRGNRSLNALNTPLYVIDGVPVSGGLSELSTSDIESVDVLKDASATAIYGSRGSNGVVLISTRRGERGKTQINFNSFFGIQNATRTIPMMNGAEWVELVREANRATTKTTPYPLTPSLDWDRKLGYFTAEPSVFNKIKKGYDDEGNWHSERVPYTDWTGKTLQTSPIQNYQVSVNGGDEKIQILASSSFFNHEGIVKGQDYSRYSIRLNFDWQPGKNFLIGARSLFSHAIRNNGDNLYSSIKSVPPLADLYDENGDYTTSRPGGDPQLWNELLNLEQTKKTQKRDRFLGSYYFEIKLPFSLSYRSNIGVDVIDWHTPEFFGQYSTDRAGGLPRAINSQTNSRMVLWENLLFFNKRINEHSIDMTFLQSVQQETTKKTAADVHDLPYDSQLWYNIGSANSISSVSSDYSQWRLASFMGRVNYNFKDKYLLTLSARYDGSSRLAPGHKWVLFPSGAFAWRLNQEPFLERVEELNDLKLRLGYGITGNTSIDPYKTQGLLDFARYSYNSEGVLAFFQYEMPNGELSWEKTKQWNFGIDFNLFNNRFGGTLDLYRQKTTDLLMERQLPVVSGFPGVMANIGEIENRGVELSVNSVNVKTANYNWMTDIVFSKNKERIVHLYNGKENDEGNKWFIGKPVSIFYDYKSDGVWQLEDQAELDKWGGAFKPGEIKVIDRNNDYKITSEDRFVLGQAEPKFTVSMSNYFAYKNVDFNFFLYGALGQMKMFDRNWSLNGRYNGARVNFWRIIGEDKNGKPVSNKSNEAPRPNIDYEIPNYITSLYYLKSSFLRIGQVTLGYTFPDFCLKWAGISKLRVYTTVQNLHVFTNYPGTDPETEMNFNEPRPRSFILGLNVSFL